jgi:2-oxo-3-hexenedioate decarboxylase
MSSIASIATDLDAASTERRAVAQPEELGQMSLAAAYQVQRRNVQHRLDRGERVVGVKLGFTSRAKMVQMGISDLIWGRITDAMAIPEGGTVRRERYIHPRCEPEIAFILKRKLSPNPTLAEAQIAVDAVAPAIEIIDSRFKDFKFSLPDVIADNTSAAGFVIGTPATYSRETSNIGILLIENGSVVQVGSSAAILGNPMRALTSAARLCAMEEFELEPGMIVLAGAATAAIPLQAGSSVRAEFQGLGTVSFNVGD